MKDPDIVALLQRQTDLSLRMQALAKDIERASSRHACRKRWQWATRELLDQLQALMPLGEPLELLRWRRVRQAIDAARDALEECKACTGE